MPITKEEFMHLMNNPDKPIYISDLIFNFLYDHPDDAFSTKELIVRLKKPSKSIKRSLKILQEKNMIISNIDKKKIGQPRYWMVNPDVVRNNDEKFW